MGAVLYLLHPEWLWIGVTGGGLIYLVLLVVLGGISWRRGGLPSLTV
jgi:hypothetical protein